MFPPFVRKIMILAAFAAAVFNFSKGDESGFVFLCMGALLVYFDIRCGSIVLSYSAFRRQDFNLLRRLITGTTKPQWLRPPSKACYYFLKGILHTIDEEYGEAKACYLQAANNHLRPQHLQCLAYCALADMSLHLGQHAEAEKFLAQAKSFPNQSEVEQMIDELEKRMNTKDELSGDGVSKKTLEVSNEAHINQEEKS